MSKVKECKEISRHEAAVLAASRIKKNQAKIIKLTKEIEHDKTELKCICEHWETEEQSGVYSYSGHMFEETHTICKTCGKHVDIVSHKNNI